MPPSLFATVVQGLHQAGLTEGARVVVEKPFGHDLASARALAAELHRYLDERQLLRIDHFLGKEPVLDLQYLRFANAVFEPLWNRSHVAAVQLTLAEDFGVEGRGGFYDLVGALRDVVQNHLLQVLALVAMEPPVGAGPDAVQDKKLEVFRAMPPAEPARAVRGQYQGYRDVEGVAKDSTTETFVALRLAVDNWRWSGVPFLIRAGKKMTMRCTEVRVIFRRPPRLAFLDEPARPEPSQVVVRIDPDPGVRLVLLAKATTEVSAGSTSTSPSPSSSACRPSPTNACSTTRSRGTRRSSAARISSRRPGASSSPSWTRPRPSNPTSRAAWPAGCRRARPRPASLARTLARATSGGAG